MDYLTPILKGFVSNPWIIVLIVVAVLLRVSLPRIKGKVGEGIVNLAAKLRLDPKQYTLLKDVTIPAKTGTSQIDHVILSVFGIFVIETKNYGGAIYGTEKGPLWTQAFGKKKTKFQNPIRQNMGHIRALAELLDLPESVFHNIVVFIGDAKFKTKVPAGVYLDGRYANYIKSQSQVVLTSEQVAAMRTALEDGRLKPGIKPTVSMCGTSRRNAPLPRV